MSKFKLDDKVKLKRGDWGNGALFKTITHVQNSKCCMDGISIFYNDDELEHYIEEVNKYDLKLSFKEVMCREVNEGEIWESDNYIITLRKSGGGCVEHKIKSSHIFGFNEMKKFKLQRPKVSFVDAIKAYFEGKVIVSKDNKYYDSDNQTIEYNDIDAHKGNFYYSADETTIEEREDKWIILD